MQVIHKDAAVTAPVDDAFPGTFEAILSAPTKDRDGETLLASEWKQPLPDHITVDMDHEMTVAGTIGSARPWIDEKGNLRISGRFASTPKAQEVRTLMQEGHINRTSVAFMSSKSVKDGVSSVEREVLNAAIVAIPANREAVILSAKGLKAGARNSKTDQEHLDSIATHLAEAGRHAVALGAIPKTGADDPQGGDTGADADVAAAKTITFPLIGKKDAGADDDAPDPVALISATDAAIDEAKLLFAQVDVTTLPEPVAQGIALILAAGTNVDELMDALGIYDPDEDADTAADSVPAPAAAKAAPGAATKSAPVEDHSIEAAAARFRLYSTLSER